MKVAVIINEGSCGGWRWVCDVFGGIKKYYPDADITVFYQKNAACPSDILQVMEQSGLKVNTGYHLPNKPFNKKKYSRIKLVNNVINGIRKKLKNKKTLNFMQYLNQNMDIVFNSWPYSTTPMKLKIPYLFIPHDFIFTHYFGHHVGNVYNRKWWQDCRNLIQGYLDFDCIPCTTTKYIANELKRTFPQYKGDINTVLIVPNNNMKKMSHEQISEIMARLEVKGDYILLATNDFHHKNTEEALTAYYYVKQKYPDLKMIIVGYGTEGVYVKMNCPYYADHVSDNEDYDIKSLGLVSNEEINALIQNARILLNVSLCEAACGSGQDAWFLDTPTVISDIPPYLEQVKILGVKTEFVNPKNSEDIAKHILFLLDNPDKALENAKVSEQALKTVYTEKDMADNYMTVFKKYIRSIH